MIMHTISRLSVEDALHIVLPLVVPTRTPVVDTAVYQILTVNRYFGIVGHSSWVEAFLELVDGLVALCETGHGLAIAGVHQLSQDEDAVLVLPARIESLIEKLPELLEMM